MRNLAFFQKELLEQRRTGKVTILLILFVLFGIMNPAIAKLTPWLLEMLADSLAESGMTVTSVTVTAMDSWVQFFKNIPMALIAFVLLEGSIFTREYRAGTLVLSLTKGLSRRRVVLSKAMVLTGLWTLGYWLCFLITYGYNAWFWDNAVAQKLLFSVLCWWLFGLWIVGLITLFSVLGDTNTAVLLGTGSVVLICYLVSLIPQCSRFLPIALINGNGIIHGSTDPRELIPAVCITVGTALVCLTASIPLFNKKQL